MRPLRLHLEGFTCYKQPTDITFDGLDLFAITGATGSGKSSIVDGITYALYGRVPRLGNEVRSLISLGSERLQAAFEFAVDGDRYRVVRSTGNKGAGHVQLFHFDSAREEWQGLEDRSAGVAEKVRALLGLDYEGFIRSVLLPQGQFHLFLSGEPKERRQVLSDLLRLEVYDRIMQAANARCRGAEGEAAAIARRLAEDYADATPQALKARNEELTGCERSRRELAERSEALTKGRQSADALRTTDAARADATAKLEAARSTLEAAESTLRDGSTQIGELEARIRSVQQEIEAAAYDAESHQRLKLALTPARELENAVGRTKALSGRQKTIEKSEAEAQKLVAVRRNDADQAASALAAAEATLDELRRRDAAARLRADLTAGEPCPVCGQPVALIPPGEHVALDEAQRKRDEAAAAQAQASGALQTAERDHARAETELEAVNRDVDSASQEAERWRGDLLKRLGAKEPVAAAVIQQDIRDQDAAQKRVAERSRERDAVQKARDGLQREFVAAEAKAGAAREAVALHEEAAAKHQEEAAAHRDTLAALAAKHAWRDVSDALERGRDTLSILSGRQSEVARGLAGVDQAIGAAQADVKRIETGIAQAKKLRAEEKSLQRAADTAKHLANLLRADRFQAYVQRAALKALAEDASRHLRLISDNRYDLDLEEPPEGRDAAHRRESQEFVVIDHWGDLDKRSVKTLSGGETFLASLSLALALAERLPELGAAVRPTRLDSLFLDEGFGTLDEESLEAVAAALDRLHLGGNGSQPSGRVIGVITHRTELAERMPARIRVLKSQEGSRVEQE